MYKKCPINLGMVETAWIATGGGTNQLQPTHLSPLHFRRDANSRMNAWLTFDVLSGKTGRMLQAAIEDDEVVLGNFRSKNVFRPLMHFIIKMNELTDIVNTWDPHTKENGLERQRKLLQFLTWMQKWKNDHDERVKRKERAEWNFFADDTWNCIQMLVMSHLVLIQIYCIEKGMKLVPRKLNTDPCENYFGNGRQMVGGSTHAMTTSQWGHADAKAGLAEAANFAAIGNSKNSQDKAPSIGFKKRMTKF